MFYPPDPLRPAGHQMPRFHHAFLRSTQLRNAAISSRCNFQRTWGEYQILFAFPCCGFKTLKHLHGLSLSQILIGLQNTDCAMTPGTAKTLGVSRHSWGVPVGLNETRPN